MIVVFLMGKVLHLVMQLLVLFLKDMYLLFAFSQLIIQLLVLAVVICIPLIWFQILQLRFQLMINIQQLPYFSQSPIVLIRILKLTTLVSIVLEHLSKLINLFFKLLCSLVLRLMVLFELIFEVVVLEFEAVDLLLELFYVFVSRWIADGVVELRWFVGGAFVFVVGHDDVVVGVRRSSHFNKYYLIYDLFYWGVEVKI